MRGQLSPDTLDNCPRGTKGQDSGGLYPLSPVPSVEEGDDGTENPALVVLLGIKHRAGTTLGRSDNNDHIPTYRKYVPEALERLRTAAIPRLALSGAMARNSAEGRSLSVDPRRSSPDLAASAAAYNGTPNRA